MKCSTTNFYFAISCKLGLLLVIFMFTNLTIAQSTQRAIPNDKSSGSSNFFEIQKEMDNYWEAQKIKLGKKSQDGIEEKVPNWKLYKRWEYFWEQRVNQQTGEFPTTNSVIEYEKYLKTQKSLNKTTYNENWTNLGTNSSTSGYAGIGRINCIAFHPSDANTFWVGSPSGGIWKTTNGGTSWTILNNSTTVLGVSAIAVPSDYATTNTLYIATGDRDGGSMWSLSGQQVSDNVTIGVLKSTDGGANWNPTGLSYLTSDGRKVYDLIVDPSNSQVLLASTSFATSGPSSNGAIYRTTDGGANWTMSTGSYRAWRLAFKPGNSNIVYGTEAFGGDQWFERSTDNGATWTDFTYGSGTDASRTELAVTPADPTLVYLLCANSGGGVNGVYKSTNSGVSFTKVNTNSATQPGMLGYYTDGRAPATGQGTYDLCIAVDPSNANNVFIGGITTWKSTDGGVTWAANNNWTPSTTYNLIPQVAVVHADKHALVFQNASTLFEGNDGGIYKTTNGGSSWEDKSNGLVISQLYRIGVSQTNSAIVLTGLQDNGSKLYNTGFWTDVTGGDGMECIVDYSNASYMYATYVRGTIYRSTAGGADFFPTTISANIPGGQPTGAWVTPYLIDQNNSSTLFAGFDKVWKTTDRGNTWTSASQVLSSTTKLRSLAIAPSNSNYLYAADQTNMWRTTDGGATNWTPITLPTTANFLTYISVKNNDPNTVWISYGGYTTGTKVYESTNGGANWTNISAGLPNLPVMCVIQYKTATDRHVLFAGTDVGVYVKDGANNWAAYNTGLPNVVVTELEVLYTGGTDKLRAGTYGRGLWETNIDAALPVELSLFTASFDNNLVTLKWSTQTESQNYGFEVERRSKNNESDKWMNIGFVNGSGNSNSLKNYSYNDKDMGFGTFLYRLKQIDNNGQFKYSDVVEVYTGEAPTTYALKQNYPNPFNPVTTIKYQIPNNGLVRLEIYNLLGSKVADLVNEVKTAGEYIVGFDASNLPSGVYLYKLQSGNFVETKKLMLLK